jgi:hypothetical protein
VHRRPPFVGFLTALIMYKSIQQVDRSIEAALEANKQAKTANDLTRDAFQLTQRPWISVTVSILGPLDYRDTGEVGLDVAVVMKNAGQMPALFADPYIEMNPLGGERQDPVKEQGRICGKLRNEPMGNVLTLFFQVKLLDSE